MNSRNNCSNQRIEPNNPLVACNGEPHSDEFLFFLLKKSVKNEDYEEAAVYRDELIRRGFLNIEV